MDLIINDKRKIFSIQEEFSNLFPYLKLEFFSTPHPVGSSSAKKFLHQNNKTLAECRTIHNNGRLSVSPNMTVSDLEQGFNTIYGLSVQIFRKSGKVWLETTVTDGWTLEEQNRQGEDLSKTA